MALNTTRSRFFGPLFPDVWDVPGRRFFGPLLPDPGPALDLVTPTDPLGVATFALDLDSALDMTLEWQTDVGKWNDGTELRGAVGDDPRRRFRGSALLIGGVSVRDLRAKLRQFAHTGATFSLGLPFESLLLAADASGTTLTVKPGALASCDWANPGQRVVVVGKNRTAITAVVQSASGTTITLDVAPGVVGREGGRVMPIIPVHLTPQQGFQRYTPSDGIERWAIDASASSFGWTMQPVAAQLAGVDSGASGNFDEVIFQALTPGSAGNDIRVSMFGDSLSGVDIHVDGNDVEIHHVPDTSTMGDLAAAIAASDAPLRMIGSWYPPNTLSSIDEFPLTNLSGGSDGDYVADGQGAALTIWKDRPVFDRRLLVETTNDDSLQAANEIVDLGGLPTNVGQAVVPDWGRHIATDAPAPGAEWQWLKRFLSGSRARQRGFWLPTWRNDLVAVSSGVNTLTITAGAEFSNWYPEHADIQIRQVDGTISYATISSVTDNGDGTLTLDIGSTLSGVAIEMVSWLELCRFEDDAFTVRFEGHRFRFDATARVVTQ